MLVHIFWLFLLSQKVLVQVEPPSAIAKILCFHTYFSRCQKWNPPGGSMRNPMEPPGTPRNPPGTTLQNRVEPPWNPHGTPVEPPWNPPGVAPEPPQGDHQRHILFNVPKVEPPGGSMRNPRDPPGHPRNPPRTTLQNRHRAGQPALPARPPLVQPGLAQPCQARLCR